jgi:hypothetical protein
MEDYRKMASMAQFMVELLEEQPLTGTPLEEATVKTKNANEEFR